MTIAEFDHLPKEKKRELLLQCCGSNCWADKMLSIFPFEDLVELEEAAEEKWYECNEEDWKEAFDHHPKIGDMDSLKQKFTAIKTWAEGEQAGFATTSEEVLKEMQESNDQYQKKFGFIYIVSATGKTATKLLSTIKDRLNNSAENEIKIAAEEQNKITQLRLQKLFA
jgi:2-oxo-4-hydroxy-4-carboxy-5-ureidoimidazoline decarboxylase